MIYLDNAATTKMFDSVIGVMQDYACNAFYNPSAGYAQAVAISKKLDEARAVLLEKLGAKGDIIFTGGATESNNLAIRGSLRNGKCEYVFSSGEHPSVYNVAKYLEESGYVVKFVPLQKNGQIDYDFLEHCVNERTRLISTIHVSNETGAINDLKRINEIRNRLCPKAIFHADGVQAFCKIPLNLTDLGVDLYTVSAHKFHGPKGVGALYVKNRSGLKNIIFGGGQEGGLRSGTENVAGIIGMISALQQIDVGANFEKVKRLESAFLKEIKACRQIEFLETESPYIISLSFAGINGETLMRSLEKYVIVGTGSACSAKHAGNRILNEIGFAPERIKSSLRVSFSADQTEEEIAKAAKIIVSAYKNLFEKVK